MNKILREEMEYLIYCDDKAITPDVKDDVSLTLQYIDELEQRIDKAIEFIKDNKEYTTIEKFIRMNTFTKHDEDILTEELINKLLDILKGSDVNGN